MKKLVAHASIRLVLGFLFIVSLFIFGNILVTKAEDAPTVEGEWEIVSVSSDTEKSMIGSKVSISRNGDSYEVKGINADSRPRIYTGNERRIVHTAIEDLIASEDVHESSMPVLVKSQLVGKQVPINYSFTLSADGNFLTREQDGKGFDWQTNTETGEVRNVKYDVAPGYYKRTLKRVSLPAGKVEASAVAQVEFRGEFYFLTKDGRKVTGEEASKVSLEEGTKVVTGSDGHIKMTLPDNTTFTVGPNSDLVIDKFVYDPDKSPEKIMATMTKGVFRWVTGKAYGDAAVYKDPAQMKVNLPVVAVGIRGTDFEATVAPDGSGSVVLNFGQLEITEKKTGFTFILNAGEKITFGADGSVSRPMKIS